MLSKKESFRLVFKGLLNWLARVEDGDYINLFEKNDVNQLPIFLIELSLFQAYFKHDSPISRFYIICLKLYSN